MGGFAGLAEFFHYGLDEFLGVSELLGDHAEVHGGEGGVALAGAIDTVLADEDQGIGDAVEGDGQAAAVAAEALLEVLQFVVMLLKCRHVTPSVSVAQSFRPEGFLCHIAVVPGKRKPSPLKG